MLRASSTGLAMRVRPQAAPAARVAHRALRCLRRVRELDAAAKKKGIVLGVFHNRRLDADIQTLRKVVMGGRLGRLWRIHSRMDFDDPATLEAGPTGGLLRDLGSHLVDQMLWLLGPVTSVDAQLDFDWSEDAPAPGLPVNEFSVRWTGFLVAPESGDYEVVLTTDDGSRLWLNDRLVADDWTEHAPRSQKAVVRLTNGQRLPLKIEYFERSGGAVAKLGLRRLDV